MKKQIITLILSAFIFTTNPLFAMEHAEFPDKVSGTLRGLTLEEPSDKTIVPSRKLTPEELLARTEGFGILENFSDEILMYTLKKLPVVSLSALSCTSKAMNSACEDQHIWRGIAKTLLPALLQDELIDLDKKGVKQLIQKYGNLFCDPNKNYQISMDMFKYFIRHSIPNTGGQSFEFTIGNEGFLLEDNGPTPFFTNFLFDKAASNENPDEKTEKNLAYLNTQPIFLHPRIALFKNTDSISFAAQLDNRCFQSNFGVWAINQNCNVFDILSIYHHPANYMKINIQDGAFKITKKPQDY